jgi:hypothetical protein
VGGRQARRPSVPRPLANLPKPDLELAGCRRLVHVIVECSAASPLVPHHDFVRLRFFVESFPAQYFLLQMFALYMKLLIQPLLRRLCRSSTILPILPVLDNVAAIWLAETMLNPVSLKEGYSS